MAAGIPTIAAIQQATAERFNVGVDVMREPDGAQGSRTPERVRPRQTAMALSVLLTNHAYERIGHFFGDRDHSTVWLANKAVAERRREDPKLHKLMRDLTLELVRPQMEGVG